MSQPKNYGITEEISLLKDMARRFYSDNYSDQKLHQLVASNADKYNQPQCNWQPSHWGEMVGLGWNSVAIPEEQGGMGMPLVAAAVLAEESGLAACPSPLLETLKATYLLKACSNASASSLMEKIASGSSVALAVSGTDGLYDTGNCGVTLTDGHLNGTAYYVQDALKAEYFIVKVNQDGTDLLYAIPAHIEGFEIIPDVVSDLTRDQAHLSFNNVKVSETHLLTGEEGAQGAIITSSPAVYILAAADMVGTSEWLLQTTAEYAKTRVQFDRPIGFFQAVKHPLVDLMIAIDEAKSVLYNAACAYDHEPEKAQELAHMAKAAASDAADFAANKAIQLHGGIAITWECYVHVFAKRAKHSEFLYGDGTFHRQRLMDILLNRAA